MFTPARTVTQRLYMRDGMTNDLLSSTAGATAISRWRMPSGTWQSGDEDPRIPQSKHLEEAIDRAVGAAVADPDRDDPV
jgi:hypothetical protein